MPALPIRQSGPNRQTPASAGGCAAPSQAWRGARASHTPARQHKTKTNLAQGARQPASGYGRLLCVDSVCRYAFCTLLLTTASQRRQGPRGRLSPGSG